MLTLRPFALSVATVMATLVIFVGLAGPVRALEISPELQQVIDGAKKEGRVLLTMPQAILNGSDGAHHAIEQLNKLFGLNLDVSWSPGPGHAAEGAKLLTESQAHQPASSDVYVGAAVHYAPLIKTGLFRKVDWASLLPGRIPATAIGGGGLALETFTGIAGVNYNKSAEVHVGTVTSMSDFLKPDWKGKFYTNAFLGGFDVMASQEIWGEDRVADYLRAIGPQLGGVIGCGADDRIASGEVPVLVLNCDTSSAYTKRYEDVLGAKYLQDASNKLPSYLAVPQNSTHPNAAILYVLYWATQEGQQYLWETRGTDMAEYPESHDGAIVAKLKDQGITMKDVTIEWWQSQTGMVEAHDRLVKLLQQVTTK